MEPDTKKFKVDMERQAVSGVTLDPFEKRHDASALILQHLSCADILNATEVSPDWSKIINEDHRAIRKIKLKFDAEAAGSNRAEEQANIKVLLASKRKYANAEIHFTLFKNFDQRNEVLEKFACSLVNLECDFTVDDNLPEVTFLKLKSMIVGNKNVKRAKLTARKSSGAVHVSITHQANQPPPAKRMAFKSTSTHAFPRVSYPYRIPQFLKLTPNLESLVIYDAVTPMPYRLYHPHQFATIDLPLLSQILSTAKNLKEVQCGKDDFEELQRYALSKGAVFSKIPL